MQMREHICSQQMTYLPVTQLTSESSFSFWAAISCHPVMYALCQYSLGLLIAWNWSKNCLLIRNVSLLYLAFILCEKSNKLLLLIKPLTYLFTSSCENPAACQDDFPVMFWAVWCLPLGLPKLLYLPARHSSFKSSSSILGRVCSHAGHCCQVQHLSFSSSFFKTSADVFLVTEHYIQTRLKSSYFFFLWRASRERSWASAGQ